MFWSFFSTFTNYNIYLASQLITDGFLTKQFAIFSKPLQQKDIEVLSNFKTYFQNYFFKFTNLVINLVYIVCPIVTISQSSQPDREKFIFTIIFILMIIAMIFGGFLWIRTSGKLRKSIEESDIISKLLTLQRVLIPAIYNVSTTYFSIILVSIVARFELTGFYIQLMIFISSISFGWILVSTIEELGYAKKNLIKLTRRLSEIEEKYVINNRSYTSLCKLCEPDNDLIKKSKQNNSLILKDFIPMSITNDENNSHIYSYEFLPGLYQLNGLNGIGKTTLLRSLTLPEGVLIEKSKGEVAFQGKAFFEETDGIFGHRKKFKYVGSSSLQDDVHNLNLELFYEFSALKSALENFQEENHISHSEGEKGVVSIATVYQECLNGVNEKILLIDETLSRIYGRKDQPLRQEVISLISKMIEIDDELIIIVVDHMTEVESAKQLHITKHHISEI